MKRDFKKAAETGRTMLRTKGRRYDMSAEEAGALLDIYRNDPACIIELLYSAYCAGVATGSKMEKAK